MTDLVCGVEIGRCADGRCADGPRLSHRCYAAPGHPGDHACPCGARWAPESPKPARGRGPRCSWPGCGVPLKWPGYCRPHNNEYRRKNRALHRELVIGRIRGLLALLAVLVAEPLHAQTLTGLTPTTYRASRLVEGSQYYIGSVAGAIGRMTR